MLTPATPPIQRMLVSDRTFKRAEDYAPMRAVLRTLTVLRALNVRNGATVLELSRTTGISRAALYRVLETLREAGYIALDLSGRHYCLTLMVRCLAEGFAEEDWVTQVSRPALKALQKKVLWPVDLGTFMDSAMWIRETTRPQSTLTMDRGTVGIRFPMLNAATGRAYLAFCPDDEREQILSNLARAREPGCELLANRASFDRKLAQTRARGYGIRFGEPPLDSGAIAVPILSQDRVLGCVNLTFARKSMSPAEAARQFLADMQATATRIGDGAEQLARMGSGDGRSSDAKR
jgi:IclR family transcriptional regulator, mhp operon transcriptional activator